MDAGLEAVFTDLDVCEEVASRVAKENVAGFAKSATCRRRSSVKITAPMPASQATAVAVLASASSDLAWQDCFILCSAPAG